MLLIEAAVTNPAGESSGEILRLFDRHAFAQKPRGRYVLMPTKSALSGARRARVTGFGAREPRVESIRRKRQY